MNKYIVAVLLPLFLAACTVQTDAVEGKQGPRGEVGSPGYNGHDGTNGQDGKEGTAGLNGKDGVAGPPGPPGTTSWVDDVERVTTHVNVGIGTFSPQASLDVAGTLLQPLEPGQVTVPAGSNVVTGTGTQFLQQLQHGDAIKIGLEVFSVEAIASDTQLTLSGSHVAGALNATAFIDSSLLTVRTGTGHQVAAIDKTGNVGIGTATPGATLEVNGTTRLGSDATGIKSIKMYSGTLPSNTFSMTLGLPLGWSCQDSLVFLSFGFAGPATNDFWFFTNSNSPPPTIYARINCEGVIVGFQAADWGKKYRIVVARFE